MLTSCCVHAGNGSKIQGMTADALLSIASVAELVDASRYNLIRGQVAELVDALALGASAERRKGSSPFLPTCLVGMTSVV